jgi:hypothetical protein
MFFVLYNSGAGGDMVSSVIDSTDYEITDIDVRPNFGSLRQRLKNSIMNSHKTNEDCRSLFFGNGKKTELLSELEKNYGAVTTGHDFAFMRGSNGFVLNTIVIDDSDYEYAVWCMNRCYIIQPKYHPIANDSEIEHRIGRVEFGKSFGNPNVITVKDILEGRLISFLKGFIDKPLNTEIYEYWLSTIVTKVPPIK